MAVQLEPAAGFDAVQARSERCCRRRAAAGLARAEPGWRAGVDLEAVYLAPWSAGQRRDRPAPTRAAQAGLTCVR
jgi:hypothetical protein